MNEPRKGTNAFALLIGAFLLIEGIFGLTSPVVFGVLTTNLTHAIIHILLGVVGIGLGWMGRARGYCIFLGILLLIVGLLRFVPGASEFVVRILNVNPAVAWLNIVVGAVALLVAFMTNPSRISRD